MENEPPTPRQRAVLPSHPIATPKPRLRHRVMRKLSTFRNYVFRPWTTLMLFVMINMLIYIDRGATNAVLVPIRDQFHLSSFQQGVVSASFMVGYMITSPLFAHFSYFFRPTFLIASGLLFGMIPATLFCSFAPEFYTLCIARAITGVGEAGFAGLSATIIDDIAPEKWKNVWLALLFGCLPVGMAVGYLLGGLIASASASSWRYVYFAESILLIPVSLITYAVPQKFAMAIRDAPRRSINKTAGDNGDEERYTLLKSAKILITTPSYIFTVLGYAELCFVIGALAVFGPEFLVKARKVPLAQATFAIGALTCVSGLLGTGIGGWITDKLGGTKTAKWGATPALLICFIVTLLGLPFGVFTWVVKQTWASFLLLGGSLSFLFTTTTPVNTATISVTPDPTRSLAMAVQIFCIHALGDAISPPIIGALIDATKNRQLSMCICFGYLIVPATFFLLGTLCEIYRRRHQCQEEERQALLKTSPSLNMGDEPPPTIAEMPQK